MWSFLYVSELWMLLRGCAQAEVRWTRACLLCEGFAAGTKEHQAASSESQILQFDCGSSLRTKPALCLPWVIHSLNHGVDLSWDDPGSRSSQGWGRITSDEFSKASGGAEGRPAPNTWGSMGRHESRGLSSAPFVGKRP